MNPIVTITLIKSRFRDLTLHASRNWFEDLDLRKVGPSSSDGKSNHPTRPSDPILCFGPHSHPSKFHHYEPKLKCIIHILEDHDGSRWILKNQIKGSSSYMACQKKPHCSLSHETMGGRLMKNQIGSTYCQRKETFMTHFLLVLAWPPPRFCMSMDPPISLLYEGYDLKNLDIDPFFICEWLWVHSSGLVKT